jgi:hypothetical protein
MSKKRSKQAVASWTSCVFLLSDSGVLVQRFFKQGFADNATEESNSA